MCYLKVDEDGEDEYLAFSYILNKQIEWSNKYERLKQIRNDHLHKQMNIFVCKILCPSVMVFKQNHTNIGKYTESGIPSLSQKSHHFET